MGIIKFTAPDTFAVFAITMPPNTSRAFALNLKENALFQPNLDLGFSSLR
jgi:hypothetical protein